MPSTGENSIESYYKISSAIPVILMLLFFCVGPLAATEPLEVIITGIEGDALKNVRETLVILDGLVREGRVNAIWLERFARQAVGKVETALEPFGYYKATVSIEPEGEGSRLRVLVVPGEPVRLAGPGSEEKPLRRLIATFPLNRGDVLLHQRYEEFKGALLA
jgi:translocation and assembly module TamA